MKTAVKRINISLPADLYEGLKRIAEREYNSVSGLIRESVLEKVEDDFTAEEILLIEEGSEAFHRGEGIDWRQISRD